MTDLTRAEIEHLSERIVEKLQKGVFALPAEFEEILTDKGIQGGNWRFLVGFSPASPGFMIYCTINYNASLVLELRTFNGTVIWRGDLRTRHETVREMLTRQREEQRREMENG